MIATIVKRHPDMVVISDEVCPLYMWLLES